MKKALSDKWITDRDLNPRLPEHESVLFTLFMSCKHNNYKIATIITNRRIDPQYSIIQKSQ
jgi:hypothetical protein